MDKGSEFDAFFAKSAGMEACSSTGRSAISNEDDFRKEALLICGIRGITCSLKEKKRSMKALENEYETRTSRVIGEESKHAPGGLNQCTRLQTVTEQWR